MCGILGSLNFYFDSKDLDLIQHRGPDFGKIEEYNIDEKNIIRFGHRRLSIIDLSEAGHQPMTTEDQQFSIIFNGEIYNHQLLREKLPDVSFKSHSDTETILYYISKFGIESIKDFNGIFSLSILDRIQNKLYLARDPFGVKPLYFTIQEKSIIFSSEIRAISNLIPTSLDMDHLSVLLKLRYNPSPDTLYKEISKLPPAHLLTYDLSNDQYKIEPYQKKKIGKVANDLHKAIIQYGDLFEKAIQRQMMSDVDLGVLLSGGVDSALVTYYAQKSYAKPIKTFTVGFLENDDSNELKDAKETADFLKTHHHEIIINEEDFISCIESVVNIVEEPIATTSSIPMYFLNKEVSKHLKVVLTGQGADEPLGGYPKYKSEIYRQFSSPYITQKLLPILPFIKNEKIRRFIYAMGEKDIVKRFEKTFTLFNDQEIKNLNHHHDKLSYDRIKYFYDYTYDSQISTAEHMMRIDLRMNLSDDLLLYTDKISMHFGIETRVPFLDVELVEFMESLPLEFKIHKGKGKYIHKEFSKMVLPSHIVERNKKGFKSPTKRWFNNQLGDLLISFANNPHSDFNKIIDGQEVLKILAKHKQGFNLEKQLFLILSLYFWYKNTFSSK